jgi:hypothetical protein
MPQSRHPGSGSQLVAWKLREPHYGVIVDFYWWFRRVRQNLSYTTIYMLSGVETASGVLIRRVIVEDSEARVQDLCSRHRLTAGVALEDFPMEALGEGKGVHITQTNECTGKRCIGTSGPRVLLPMSLLFRASFG